MKWKFVQDRLGQSKYKYTLKIPFLTLMHLGVLFVSQVSWNLKADFGFS